MSGIYDIMGYEDDELLGDELDELLGQGTVDDFDEGGLLGAKRRAKRRLARRGYSRDRGMLMSLGTVAIAVGGGIGNFIAAPQVPFRPKRIIISANVAGVAAALDVLVINQINVGKNSQLVAAGDFPATAFAADAQDIGVKFDTAYPGIDILVQATNNDAANIMTTTIGMFGYAAER
jgi:hypothetical protein